MSTELFRARYILSGSRLLEDHAIRIRDGRIRSLEPLRDLSAAEKRYLRDLGDTLLVPPLVNAHCHLELSHFPRWRAEATAGPLPEDFVDWILDVIRIKRSRTPLEYADSLRDGLRLSLEAGTGAVGDNLSIHGAVRAYGDSPLAGRCFLETLGVQEELCRENLQRLLEAARSLPEGLRARYRTPFPLYPE